MVNEQDDNTFKLTEGVFVVKNFVDAQDIKVLIESIEASQHLAISGQDGKRLSISIGKVPLASLSNVDPLHEIHKVTLKSFPMTLQDVFNKITKSTADFAQRLFEDKAELHCSNAIFAKQLPGAVIASHIDSQPGGDEHLYYSAVLYLNTIIDGNIEFPNLKVSHHPQEGDLLLYRSNHANSQHEVNLISEPRYSIPIFLSKDKECYIE